MAEEPRGGNAEQLKANFRALAPTYDKLRFLQICARRLADLTPIRDGARVLDVATGTGVAAIAAAEKVGAKGNVIGVDLSTEMLEQARLKSRDSALPIEFREGDATRLEFDDGTFDDVICSSSLFFIPDMAGAVREWRRVLVEGGYLGFSTFGAAFLQPLRSAWEARLKKYGATPAALPTHRLNDEGSCVSLLRAAGFEASEVWTEQLGYFVATPEDRWADIVAGIEGKPMQRLGDDVKARIEREHLEELKDFVKPEGLWVDVETIFAVARKGY